MPPSFRIICHTAIDNRYTSSHKLCFIRTGDLFDDCVCLSVLVAIGGQKIITKRLMAQEDTPLILFPRGWLYPQTG